ncbi:vomeronasal type-2 receptor 26-like [Rana temporaria]|uniref:vomeronasal type-2 receptor 26-like n=1 Tax=Rana temporaria TaxID=8407 RepID=UPI001AADC781|nr:vomeronasal type-2 receptor 26-like [Rana temporaria]
MIPALPCLLEMVSFIIGGISSRLKMKDPSPACRLQLRKTYEEYEYFKDGDIIIGGLFTVNYHMVPIESHMFQTHIACFNPLPNNYKNLLTFFYGIRDENSRVLQNVSLGYHIFDSCADENKAIKSILQILSGPGKTVPNYSCAKRDKIIGFIGDHYSKTTLPMAQLLGVYRYSQISYGATSHELSNKKLYPKFFRTVQNHRAASTILCKLIKFFGWTWVGILASDDDGGEKEVQELTNIMVGEGICAAFIIKIKEGSLENIHKFQRSLQVIQKSTAQILVICGSNSFFMGFSFAYLEKQLSDRTLILYPSWAVQEFLLNSFPKTFNGSLTLNSLPRNFSQSAEFFNNIRRVKYPKDLLLENIWMMFKGCVTNNPKKNLHFRDFFNLSFQNCTGEEPVTLIPGLNQNKFSTQVYISVNTMIIAINALLQLGEPTSGKDVPIYTIKQQLHYVLKKLTYTKESRTHPYYDENNEFITKYYINNWIVFNNISRIRKVGCFDPWMVEGSGQFSVDVTRVVWKNSIREIPKSQCSETCLPGSRIIAQAGIHHRCCYNCVSCSEDSENCIRCPDYEWPNEKKDLCVPRLEDFLSFRMEVITIVAILVSVLFYIKTVLIIAVFILFRDTPVVKANNKSLSFVLLVSIMLGFLCVFLFLGRPLDITCQLRQITFAVLFSVAESSILAKTLVVCIAFKATKPGSRWQKWIGGRVPGYVVITCSSVQMVICLLWSSLSPPYQELDTHSYHGRIIVQCNEGSVVGFYSVLGYMGILAAVSFIIAFFARTLPDSFNEAKYITFSMLVFCSVWIAMIPAYLGTKGKNTVAVEIFAILVSNAGLLGCIFFPKCYIIVCKPKLNTKMCLLDNRKIVVGYIE